MAKWQVGLESTLLNSGTCRPTETLKLCGTLETKTMKKNAREHNINKGMQKLTALRLGQHIDNAESLKRKKK